MARDADVLAEAVAVRLVTRLVDAQSLRGTASVVLTGGGVGIAVLEAVRRSPARAAVDWRRVDVWWGDERFVPADDPDRNERQAREALLDALDLDPARVHPMGARGGPDGDDADAAAARYADELTAAALPDHDLPSFDVLLLGIGPEGHTASIFPESPAAHDDRLVVGVHGCPKPPPTRVSLGFRALDAARETWFVVAGEDKAPAVAMALGGAGRVQVPAAGGGARRPRCGCWTRRPPRAPAAWSAAARLAAACAQLGQRLGQDGLAVLGVAALAHVGQVRLVRLGLGLRGRRVLVLARREAAARAVPGLRHGGVVREGRPGLVPVGAVEGHPHAGGGLAPLRLAHRTGADTAAPDRVAACH